MKKIVTSIILTCGILALTISAATISKFNLNGTFKGTRYQFDESKQKYIAEFQYSYELKQEGTTVTGVSHITSQSGHTADISIRGFVEGSKFYFEEYAVINATREKDMLWCLKKGSLDILSDNGQLSLSGKTASYTEIYGFECTGGYTFLAQSLPSPSETTVTTKAMTHSPEDAYQLLTYPNPFQTKATISFHLENKQNVAIDVVDITGKVVKQLTNKEYEAGTHELEFNSDANTNTSYYIVRFHIGEEYYSKSLQKIIY